MASFSEHENSTTVLIDDHSRVEEEEESYSYAMQLVCSSVLSVSLHSAIELGVFDIIAKAGEGAKVSSAEIAAQMANNTNPEAPMMLDRILRLLASHSVLSCSVVGDDESCTSNVQRLYGLAPVSNYFVSNEDGVSLGPLMALTQDKVFVESWTELKNSILEGGILFDKIHKRKIFEYQGSDLRFNHLFNKAMYNQTTMVIKRILKSYKGFENLKQLVDVGGGLGATLRMITSKYPHIKAINFDLPHVIDHAPLYQGVEHVGGDMFESVPKGDAIFMKWILHDWSDEHCLKLLKNCYEAIPNDGKVIVVEAVLPAKPEASSAAKITSEIDIILMTQFQGGKERSKQEFQALATKAGFGGIKFDCFVCNFWVMEFHK